MNEIFYVQLVDLAAIPRLKHSNGRKRKDRAVNTLGTDFDTLLTRGALCALLGAGAWALVVVLAVAVEAHTRGRVRMVERTGCPPAVRLWLLGVFVILFAGAAPAQASDTGSGSGSDKTVLESALDGLPLPDRTAGALARGHADSDDTVIVRPGDSLWKIARRLLPGDAATSSVAETVTQLYADNRRLIGADPDLLVPGQRLAIQRHLGFPVPTTRPEES